MPTVEEWKTKLRGAVDPCGAVSHAGTRRAQLDLVLGGYKDEGPTGGSPRGPRALSIPLPSRRSSGHWTASSLELT